MDKIMKKILFICISFILVTLNLNAQSAFDRMRTLVKNKDYEEAKKLINDAIRENPKNSSVYLLAGDIYFEMDKPDSALIMYLKADDIESDRSPTLRKIAKSYSALGNHNEATKIINRAIKKDPKDIYNYLTYGEILIKADSINKATLIITKAREMDKTIPDAYVALGDLYYAQNVYELARVNYEEALSLNENLMDARIKLATSYFKLGLNEVDKDLSNQYFTRSLREWNIIAEKDPKNAKAFYEQGRLLYFSRDFVKAAQSFYQYIQLRPSGSLGRWYLAQSLYEIGKCDSAKQHLIIVAEEIDSVKTKAKLLLARCYFVFEDYANSVNTFRQIEEIKPIEDSKDLELYAQAYIKSGDTLSAIPIYKRVIEANPQKCELMFRLGQLMRIIKNWDESNYFFQKYLTNCSKDNNQGNLSKVNFFIGSNFFNKEQYDSAFFYFKTSNEIAPNDILTIIYIADVYAKRNMIDSSKITLNQAINTGKNDTTEQVKNYILQAYSKLCNIYVDEKNFKELQKVAKNWTEYDPKSPYAYFYLAISFHGQNDIENACKNYKKVIQLDPKNKAASDMIKKLNCP